MSWRSISLRTQLVFTIVGLVAAAAVALTTLAYRVQVDNLERDAHRAVRMAAQSRADAVTRVIVGQQERAQRFLISAASLCGEERPSGGVAWELGCAQRALQELRASEGSIGAVLQSRRRRVARSGPVLPGDLPIPSPLARLADHNGRPTYVILAENGDASVRLRFLVDDFNALFDQPLGLGNTGEVFLREFSGTFLTAARFNAPDGAAFIERDHSCLADAVEWVGLDYRGVETIHGTHAVPGFSQPLCVDAHVSRAEALAPAGVLLNDLLRRSLILALVGVLLALIASHWMTASLQRLAASARALADGDFTRVIPTTGPSEVRSLARTLAAMSGALGEQMHREQRARHEAETANQAKDEFLAVLSHELRTPLASTLGWARLLRQGRLPAPQVDRAVGAIERSAQMQQRLVEDLLDVSRIVAGRLRLDRTAVRLSDPVRAAADELRPMAEEKQVALDVLLPSAPIVDGDAIRIQQIVTNLLTNAIKFTPSGGRITIELREVNGHAELAVTDTGIGISASFLPHLFEPFRQADGGPRRTHRGLGLGLSIVHHLVKLHGGAITATSRGPGTGARFVVRLPLAENAAANAAQLNPPADAGPALDETVRISQRLDKVRVLVVDDDDEARRLVAALLEEAGAKVDVASSAAEGHERLQQAGYSALVSDLAMPEEDGFAFMRAVRRAKPAMPAVALTGLTRREDADAALEAGFQACLTKPIDRDRLIATVAALTAGNAA